jgi:hypothetical protein
MVKDEIQEMTLERVEDSFQTEAFPLQDYYFGKGLKKFPKKNYLIDFQCFKF